MAMSHGPGTQRSVDFVGGETRTEDDTSSQPQTDATFGYDLPNAHTSGIMGASDFPEAGTRLEGSGYDEHGASNAASSSDQRVLDGRHYDMPAPDASVTDDNDERSAIFNSSAVAGPADGERAGTGEAGWDPSRYYTTRKSYGAPTYNTAHTQYSGMAVSGSGEGDTTGPYSEIWDSDNYYMAHRKGKGDDPEYQSDFTVPHHLPGSSDATNANSGSASQSRHAYETMHTETAFLGADPSSQMIANPLFLSRDLKDSKVLIAHPVYIYLFY